ncbi:MAG: hypothetical protein ABIJ45_09375 [Candidatus Zixiibacteriota bacterium]
MVITERLIIDKSDSVIFNGQILERHDSYQIDYRTGTLSIDNHKLDRQTFLTNDTLLVYFSPLPLWIKMNFGILPDVSEAVIKSKNKVVEPGLKSEYRMHQSNLNISGAKRFSVNSQSSGASRFEQSLDLSISGELSPGLTITGSLSDKGYDPEYGAINSRISELDRLFIGVKSKSFSAEIGNLEIVRRSEYGAIGRKQVSGLAGTYNGRYFGLSTLLARPRGIFKTFEFQGQDQVQGPYRISSDNAIKAIVPGSESVWLNGELLDRGVDKDYTIDYPSATITFSPKNLIDSRSRVEIDYEQLSTEFRKEIYEFSGTAKTNDARLILDLGFSREGDNKDASESIALEESDIEFLSSIGDSSELGFKESAVIDSLGDYIELFDSLGNRYFEFIGDSLGDYSVLFTSVADGEGNYLYEGIGRYRYVGDGHGDYLPIIRIPVPIREDYYKAELTAIPIDRLKISLLLNESDYDKNLFSSFDDSDNLGGLYQLTITGGDIPQIGSPKTSGLFRYRMVEKNYQSKYRTAEPDLKREFLIPAGFQNSSDENRFESSVSLTPPGPLSLFMRANYLDYKNSFNSMRGTIAVYPQKLNSLVPTVSYSQLKSEYNNNTSDGKNQIFSALSNSKLTKDLGINGGFKFDRRRHNYFGEWRGTSEKIYNCSIIYKSVVISAERYLEDTLVARWIDHQTRDRFNLGIKKSSGRFRTDLYLTAQRLIQNDQTENQIMVRTNYAFNHPTKNLAIDGSYLLTDENRFERGIRYLEVEPGQGRYIFENGQYIPDPDGNYIEVEEIFSSQSSVSRAEKSINLLYNPDPFYIRLGSTISEELFNGKDRNFIWILPFYFNKNRDSFSRKIYYSGDMKFINLNNFYFANIGGSYNFDSRQIGGNDYERYEILTRIKFNNSYRDWRFGEQGEYFRYYRDAFYFTPDDIEGFKLSFDILKIVKLGQVNGKISYRYADDKSGANVRQYLLLLGNSLRLIKGGETIFKIELYTQNLKAESTVSYRLTDNLYGDRGAVWSVRSNNKIGKDLRLSILLTGRHSNDRAAKITGRGELVASF